RDRDPAPDRDECVPELVEEDRREEPERGEDREPVDRGVALVRAEDVAIDPRHPEDDQEQEQEPRVVDADPDSANVEQGDSAAAERRPGGRGRRAGLRQSPATNVVATAGPAGAPRTVVVLVHHDSAHPGLVFHPAIPDTIERHAPRLFELGDTSPPLMWPAVL